MNEINQLIATLTQFFIAHALLIIGVYLFIQLLAGAVQPLPPSAGWYKRTAYAFLQLLSLNSRNAATHIPVLSKFLDYFQKPATEPEKSQTKGE